MYFNTAARIQSKCNEYRVKILSSDELLQKLSYANQYKRIQIGDIELRGKETKVPLSTLEIMDHNWKIYRPVQIRKYNQFCSISNFDDNKPHIITVRFPV